MRCGVLGANEGEEKQDDHLKGTKKAKVDLKLHSSESNRKGDVKHKTIGSYQRL
jgi:hypothetical protein